MQEWRTKLVHWAETAPRNQTWPLRIKVLDKAGMPPALMATLLQDEGRIVIVTSDVAASEEVLRAFRDHTNLLGESRTLYQLPDITGEARREWDPADESRRCACLYAALSNDPLVFVCTASSIVAATPKPRDFGEQCFQLREGSGEYGPEALAEILTELDYDNEYQVERPGEFARRGGILDVYSPLYENPIRLEFFGDTIDSMRFFDPDSQRSIEPTSSVNIPPRGEKLLASDDREHTFFSYINTDDTLVLWDPQQIEHHLEEFCSSEIRKSWEASAYAHRKSVSIEPYGLDYSPEEKAGGNIATLHVYGLHELLGGESRHGHSPLSPEWHWQQLRDALQRWGQQGYTIAACCGSQGEADRFEQILAQDETTASVSISIETIPLAKGAIFPDIKLILLGETELFARTDKQTTGKTARRRSKYHPEAAVQGTGELQEGQYAVHASYGIAIYRGLNYIENQGALQEVMELEFADNARLYVPLDQAHLVSRYVGGTKKLPSLSKLGSSAWQKTRNKAANAAKDLAAEMLRMHALREQSEGVAFVPEPEWERDFAQAFPFQETEDQLEAIQDVLTDMASERPMDRLLCGDAGYGKTEVAMRAAFRAVLNRKQVAVLVPTTVLAHQHYLTFTERMSEYPVRIAMLSRFRSRSEQNQTLSDLAVGKVDIVIGTHRLLGSDVRFYDLGLLILDEEQRFGVTHKEKLKSMRTEVDVLTMTATPIPRTLYFSISGIRNLSRIMTPPEERRPIKTHVAQYDPQLIRKLILYELERKGQVFFLHNRVKSIRSVADYLEKIVPEARLLVAHGRMTAAELEDVMARFIHKEADVLVCTTIIESGLDIQNTNTIIIDRADRFGLAELYQLRGRVGRYNRQAYAYLLLPAVGGLPENARERLAAIRKYTETGAGFKLALRDLEIRGAGNLLGPQQSGQIAAVGFDLYCRLLHYAINALSTGNTPQASLPSQIPQLDLDVVCYGVTAPSGQLAASIPPDYVEDAEIRVQTYQRLNSIRTLAEVEELSRECEDRFGPLPEATHNLLNTVRLRVLATDAGFSRVRLYKGRAILEKNADDESSPDSRLETFPLGSSEPLAQLDELEKILSNYGSNSL